MKIIKSKIFKIIIVLFSLGFLLGIISYFFIEKDNSFINYFSLIKNGNYNYTNSLMYSVYYNYKYALLIWICGFIFIFSIFIPFIIIFRGISLGYIIISVISIYHIKSIIILLILIMPVILINELIYIMLSFYGINFSIKTSNVFKNNRSINLKNHIKNYMIQLMVFIIGLLISSLIEIYITSNILKFVL